MGKNPPANAGDAGDTGSIPGSWRTPEGGNGNPLWYSCLENAIDRGARQTHKELDTTEHAHMDEWITQARKEFISGFTVAHTVK